MLGNDNWKLSKQSLKTNTEHGKEQMQINVKRTCLL